MAKQRELRDPIHGFIQRSEIQASLIDTRVFQRLRGIKQLAMAHLVYPGALHTRFEHSIGVMHVARRLAERLIDDREVKEEICLAALLHDIGHGPFSHVSEEILDKYYDSSKVNAKSKEKIHERLTCDIIKKDTEIGNLLSVRQRDRIIGLLTATTGESIVRSIVSGPLDADKQDYLLRDGYFCGVKYGIFDIERLIGTLDTFQDRHEKLLAASSDGVYAIEQFVLAKYHMATQVYRHKIRLVTDAMIVRALELGILVDNLEWLKRLYAYNGTDEHLTYFLEWDDARLTTRLLYPENGDSIGLATDLFRRLKERRLFKRVFSKELRKIQEPDVRDFLANAFPKNLGFRKQIENEIAEYLSERTGHTVDANHVVTMVLTVASAREQSRNSEGSIIIVNNGVQSIFEEESTLFRSINEKENLQELEVYAPVTFLNDVDKRKKLTEFEYGIQERFVKAAKQEIEKEGETNGEAYSAR